MSVIKEQSGAELQHSSLWQRNCRAVSQHVVLSVCDKQKPDNTHIKEGFVFRFTACLCNRSVTELHF